MSADELTVTAKMLTMNRPPWPTGQWTLPRLNAAADLVTTAALLAFSRRPESRQRRRLARFASGQAVDDAIRFCRGLVEAADADRQE